MHCLHLNFVPEGKTSSGSPQVRCLDCGARVVADKSRRRKPRHTSNCEHKNFRKRGKSKAGKQYYTCKDCNRNFSFPEEGEVKYRIDQEVLDEVKNMLQEGKTHREILKTTGISQNTLSKINLRYFLKDIHMPIESEDPYTCDYCDKQFSESQIRWKVSASGKRVKEKAFCSILCSNRYKLTNSPERLNKHLKQSIRNTYDQ